MGRNRKSTESVEWGLTLQYSSIAKLDKEQGELAYRLTQDSVSPAAASLANTFGFKLFRTAILYFVWCLNTAQKPG